MIKVFVEVLMLWINGCLRPGTLPIVSPGTEIISDISQLSSKRTAAAEILDLPESSDTCQGNQLGLYSWGYEVWNSDDSPMIAFLRNPSVKEYGCGDIYINVADYGSPGEIPHAEELVAFIKNVRSSGNKAVVFLTYGDDDVDNNGAVDGPTEFAETFFEWISTLSDSDLQAILPIGVSYDCEHVSLRVIEKALKSAQNLKRALVNERLGGDESLVQIEWVIEGQRKPKNTDMIMRLADRALVMNYRTHIGKSIKDPSGRDNMVTRLFDFMFTKQCEHCLDDAYATEHYKAKIRIIVEADCEIREYCGKISFCAYDAKAKGWGNEFENGAQYLTKTLEKLDLELRQGGRLTPDQYSRLFGSPTNLQLFAIHNWQWFTCFFDDPSVAVTTPIGKRLESCENYHSLANTCRSK